MEKNKIKDEIKKQLKGYALSKDLLAKALNLNEDEITNPLNELVKDGEIKYLENLELYKLASLKKAIKTQSVSKDSIVEIIKDKKIYNINQISKIFNVKHKELKATLDSLVKDNILYYSRKYDVYSVIKVATLIVKERGYAFAKVEGEEEDYYISPDDLGNVYDGDVCHIYPTGYDEKLKGAAVIDVLERAHTKVIGKLVAKGKKYIKYKVESVMNSFPVTVDVKEEDLNGAYIGAIVSCDIEYTKGY